MASAERPPSPAALFYLFADRVAARDTALEYGITVPCSEAQVSVRSLGTALVACSLWSLREQGYIRLDVRAGGFLIFKTTTLEASIVSEAEPPGLEGKLMMGLRGLESPAKVVDMVFNAMGIHHSAPFTWPIVWAARELDSLGYGSTGPPTGGQKAIGMERSFQPDCARIATAAPRFEERYAAWARFASEETQIYRLLFTAAETAIAGRIKRPDDTTF